MLICNHMSVLCLGRLQLGKHMKWRWAVRNPWQPEWVSRMAARNCNPCILLSSSLAVRDSGRRTVKLQGNDFSCINHGTKKDPVVYICTGKYTEAHSHCPPFPLSLILSHSLPPSLSLSSSHVFPPHLYNGIVWYMCAYNFVYTRLYILPPRTDSRRAWIMIFLFLYRWNIGHRRRQL